MEWNEFKEIPAKVNQYSLASDDKLSAMAKCLHKLGEIMYVFSACIRILPPLAYRIYINIPSNIGHHRYFEYDSVLKDYIMLDPLTLVRLMTTVISLKVITIHVMFC